MESGVIMAVELNSENINNYAAMHKPLLIDFWASWCAPCRQMSPIIDEIADEQTDVLVCKLDVDEYPDIASEYGVENIPNFVLVKNGQIINRQVGLCSKQTLLDLMHS